MPAHSVYARRTFGSQRRLDGLKRLCSSQGRRCVLHRPRLHRPPARRFGEQPAWPSWRDGATLSFGTQMDWPSACVAEWLTKVRLDGLQHSCLPSTRSSPSARCLTTQITLHRVCRAVCLSRRLWRDAPVHCQVCQSGAARPATCSTDARDGDVSGNGRAHAGLRAVDNVPDMRGGRRRRDGRRDGWH